MVMLLLFTHGPSGDKKSLGTGITDHLMITGTNLRTLSGTEKSILSFSIDENSKIILPVYDLLLVGREACVMMMLLFD